MSQLGHIAVLVEFGSGILIIPCVQNADLDGVLIALERISDVALGIAQIVGLITLLLNGSKILHGFAVLIERIELCIRLVPEVSVGAVAAFVAIDIDHWVYSLNACLLLPLEQLFKAGGSHGQILEADIVVGIDYTYAVYFALSINGVLTNGNERIELGIPAGIPRIIRKIAVRILGSNADTVNEGQVLIVKAHRGVAGENLQSPDLELGKYLLVHRILVSNVINGDEGYDNSIENDYHQNDGCGNGSLILLEAHPSILEIANWLGLELLIVKTLILLHKAEFFRGDMLNVKIRLCHIISLPS